MIREYVSRHDPASVRAWHEAGAWGDECVHDLLAGIARDRPDGLALDDGRWRLTFGELAGAIETARAMLAAAGVGPRTAVAVDFRSAFFNPLHAAASALGAVTLPVPPGIDDQQLPRLLGNGDVDHLLTDPERAAALGREPRPFAIHAVRPRPTSGRAFLPEVVGSTPGTSPGPGAAPAETGWGADDIYHLVPTSGTTGFPRLALRTHNSWLAMARKKIAYLRTAVPLSAEDRILVMTPVSYGIGYFHGYVIPAYLGGAPTFLMRRFDAAEALRLVEAERITILVGVPTQVIRLLELLRQRPARPLGASLYLVGGDHLDRAAAMEFEDRTGALVVALYGLVDAGLVTATALAGGQRERFASAGRPLAWTKMRLVDVAAGGAGEGEIAVQTPDGIAGYYPVDEESSRTPDGWAVSGDLGSIDADGNLHIVGRKKDVIIRGGLNISAAEVETFLAGMPTVRMAAVVGVPDPVLGERACAVLEPAEPGATITLDDIRAEAQRIGFAKKYWPEYVVLVETLPTTDNGKVDKKRIRQLAAAAVVPA